jgi:GTP 3',8-cyclase
MKPLTDRFGRTITYLRISVTDRCNLRCVYCMPPEGITWMPMREILTYEEIGQVVKTAVQLGIQQIRLTGGEPLVRKDLPWLVQSLASIDGIEEISLTTNGMLLDKLAQPLADAGLKRVNISLDTLQADKFRRITRGGDIARVWQGIAAAEAAGLCPLKINAVAVRGVNDDELISLARLSVEHPWHIRFIELMPFSDQRVWEPFFPAAPDRYLPVQEMRIRVDSLKLDPVGEPRGNGPARTFKIPGARGTVGFISPLGEHFCASCNRLRLTADGFLRPCLLQDSEINVKNALRSGEPLMPLLQQAVDAKPKGHELFLQTFPESRRMAQIGG